MFGVMNHLDVIVFEDATEAAQNGFDYRIKNIKPVEIAKVVIINKGTQGGNSTIDLVLYDQQGNSYVTMVTGNLIKSLPL